MKPKDEIQERVEVVLKKSESENRRSDIRVVHWIINGVDKGPMLEKRSFFLKDGEARMGKCVGFNKGDVRFLIENLEELKVYFT